MLPLGLLLILFAALCMGALVFVVLVVVPRSRAVALSAAAWFAAMGGCVCVWIVVGLVFLVANGIGHELAPDGFWHARLYPLFSTIAFGWVYLIAGLLACMATAALAAWMHQLVIERLTFALFRVYATAVVAGMGSVYGWVLGGVLLAKTPNLSRWIALPFWGLQMLLLVGGFGWFGFRHARCLRGRRPERLNPVTREEFEGTV